MKAIEILKMIEREPDFANGFGVSENLDLQSMFGVCSLCGAYPQGQYVWFWADRCPQPCPDFVLNVKEDGSNVYGYFID